MALARDLKKKQGCANMSMCMTSKAAVFSASGLGD